MQKKLSLQFEEMEAVAAPGWLEVAIIAGAALGTAVALT